MNLDKQNFRDQVFNELPEVVTCSNFTRCTFNVVTHFDRCNLRQCIFNADCIFEKSNIIDEDEPEPLRD